MKFSKFILFVPEYPTEGYYLIYSSFSGAVAVISKSLKDFIENHSQSYSLDKKQKENLTTLKKLSFIVENETNENFLLKNYFKKIRDSSSLNLMILTTYDCQLSCRYCIQSKIKSKTYLSRRISEKIVKWIIKRLNQKNISTLNPSLRKAPRKPSWQKGLIFFVRLHSVFLCRFLKYFLIQKMAKTKLLNNL